MGKRLTMNCPVSEVVVPLILCNDCGSWNSLLTLFDDLFYFQLQVHVTILHIMFINSQLSGYFLFFIIPITDFY